MNRTIRIVARPNRVGIDRDIQILMECLSSEWGETTFSPYRSIHALRRYVGSPDPAESIIFLGRITARWLRQAGRYLLIPNQERYPERLVPLLSSVDHVLCKTRHAREIFSHLHPSALYLGFTSMDRRLPEIEPEYDRFFHLGGGSSLKGTEDLLRLWARHPEWPTLTLIWHRRDTLDVVVPPNVDWVEQYLPDSELRALQNQCGIHLCPSRSEGWGHYITEAMSCRAVTLTTDAPPMNELVEPDRGVLVRYSRSESRNLGTNFFVDPDVLEQAIEDLISRPTSEKVELGRSARSWFEMNHARFVQNLSRLCSEMMR